MTGASDKYTLACVDVDTTGRRLIDEIVQLSAYTPSSQFAEYIMPIMNLNPAARQRHQIRVITVGFFRMLKNMQTYKVVKTKTEIAVLKDFLEWLEKLRKDDPDSKGIILMYHEQRKFVPYMLLEAFKKYDLVDRFMNSVKYFIDGFSLTIEKSGNTAKYLSLTNMAELLDVPLPEGAVCIKKTSQRANRSKQSSESRKDEHFDGCAKIRTELMYNMIEKIAMGDDYKKMQPEETKKKILDLVMEKSSPVDAHFNPLSDQKKNMDRQNSMRPIFVQYFKVTLYHRVKGVTFRRLLAEHGYDLESLKQLWNDKSAEGITQLVQSIEELKDDEKSELITLLDSHFDPEKKSVPPKRTRNNKHSFNHKENTKPRNSDGGNTKKSNNADNNSRSGRRGSNQRRNNQGRNLRKNNQEKRSNSSQPRAMGMAN